MKIRNVHERTVAADPVDLAPLLATLGQPDDMLYPPVWKPMEFDRPVGIGATGTHGTVSAYEPGRLIEIQLPSAAGIVGAHTFIVTPLGARRSRVRHEVIADAGIVGWLVWHIAIRPAHDAVLEQILDRLQVAVGAPPARFVRLSPYARVLRWIETPRGANVVAAQCS